MSTRSAPAVTAEDLRATAAANSELGRDYEDALAASLLERVDAHIERGPRADKLSLLHDLVTITIALGSIGLGVLVFASADGLGALGGTVAVIVAWVGIAVINVAHARGRRSR